jgi:hypothetical protein
VHAAAPHLGLVAGTAFDAVGADIRDKALALEVYAQPARNFEAEQRAGQVRVRAERKAGQLLAAREKAKRGPDRQGQGSQRSTSDSKTLAKHI